ncbi:MAG: hypothetical protein Q8Q30_02465 [Candidatus Woesebacteria bacterium]|nr:hypothetical protein [Candidatus Woesebacteria bacterium]
MIERELTKKEELAVKRFVDPILLALLEITKIATGTADESEKIIAPVQKPVEKT